MTGKTDALRERYELFSAGDLERALDLWTDDFVWDGGESGLPGSGRHEGKQAAIAVLQQLIGSWDRFELVADEFFENDDTAVVLAHTNLAKGDKSVRQLTVHIWRYRGDQIYSFQFLNDTLEAARLLGVA
jgi:ketosteroid isomerase-like protein